LLQKQFMWLYKLGVFLFFVLSIGNQFAQSDSTIKDKKVSFYLDGGVQTNIVLDKNLFLHYAGSFYKKSSVIQNRSGINLQVGIKIRKWRIGFLSMLNSYNVASNYFFDGYNINDYSVSSFARIQKYTYYLCFSREFHLKNTKLSFEPKIGLGHTHQFLNSNKSGDIVYSLDEQIEVPYSISRIDIVSTQNVFFWWDVIAMLSVHHPIGKHELLFNVSFQQVTFPLSEYFYGKEIFIFDNRTGTGSNVIAAGFSFRYNFKN
jgi:hypothetical protein